VLFDKIASVYLKKYIYTLALEMASPGNSNVPTVSAHFRSVLRDGTEMFVETAADMRELKTSTVVVSTTRRLTVRHSSSVSRRKELCSDNQRPFAVSYHASFTLPICILVPQHLCTGVSIARRFL